ncbi:hypothetical protein ACFL6C_01965 [Myxococcota bacterium]
MATNNRMKVDKIDTYRFWENTAYKVLGEMRDEGYQVSLWGLVNVSKPFDTRTKKYLDELEFRQGKKVYCATHEPKPEHVFTHKNCKIGTDAYVAFRNAYRQVKDQLGEPVAMPDPATHAQRAIAALGGGRAGWTEPTLYAVVPTDRLGQPRIGEGPNNTTKVYFKKSTNGQQPTFYGPFFVNSLGMVADDVPPLTNENGINHESVQQMYEWMTQKGDREHGARFLGPADFRGVSQIGARQAIVKPWIDEIGGRVFTESTAEGDEACETFRKKHFVESDYESAMKHLLDELHASGHIKAAHYFELTQQVGDNCWATSDVLVLVDDTGNAFGFTKGTLY